MVKTEKIFKDTDFEKIMKSVDEFVNKILEEREIIRLDSWTKDLSNELKERLKSKNLNKKISMSSKTQMATMIHEFTNEFFYIHYVLSIITINAIAYISHHHGDSISDEVYMNKFYIDLYDKANKTIKWWKRSQTDKEDNVRNVMHIAVDFINEFLLERQHDTDRNAIYDSLYDMLEICKNSPLYSPDFTPSKVYHLVL